MIRFPIFQLLVCPSIAFVGVFLGTVNVTLANDTGIVGAPPLKPDSGRFFETQMAPLFAKHCLVCHDSVTQDGELELTQKSAALAGGGSWNAIG